MRFCRLFTKQTQGAAAQAQSVDMSELQLGGETQPPSLASMFRGPSSQVQLFHCKMLQTLMPNWLKLLPHLLMRLSMSESSFHA